MALARDVDRSSDRKIRRIGRYIGSFQLFEALALGAASVTELRRMKQFEEEPNDRAVVAVVRQPR